MSSFDAKIPPEGVTGFKPHIYQTYHLNDSWGEQGPGRLVRVVEWPEGAPSQDRVPQAGEQRLWGPDETPVTVVSGIPFESATGTYWCVHVVHDVKRPFQDNGPRDANIEFLKPVPDVPEATYTEAEIRAAYDTEPAYTSQNLIDQLRRDA